MSGLPFLLEIGCEEIPDWMIEPALTDLWEKAQRIFDEHNLQGTVTELLSTPRRLVLQASNLIERQGDSEELVTGPPKTAPAAAVAGFAKKMGTNPGNLFIEGTAKGQYWAFRKKVIGRTTLQILSSQLPILIPRIYFPKTMYWTEKGGVRFIRPIRWIVALLGDQVVPFELAGVQSGDITRGHRRLGDPAISVTIGTYESHLKNNFVLVRAADRQKKIESEIAALDVRVKPDEALLNILVNITEYPSVILGSFDPQYLTLPGEVLVTVMRHHQKYFSVEDAGGNLAPNFVAVMNTSADPDGLVRKGNERVLRARFNDARFFWDVDQQKKLADRVADLANVTFQAKLGSYLDKTNRTVELVGELGGGEAARRAALLAKCDLTTEMVKEFTDLQGVVGGLYAKAQGEPEPVWRAIYEQYKPLSMEDSIPATADGRLVALADKIDTLRECFRVGLIPSGSKDPFALRRAAQGVVKILVEGSLALPLKKLAAGDAQLEEFLLDRIKYYFKDIREFAYDEVNAVLASGWDSLPDVELRLTALKAVRPTENFEPLAASFKRIQNILKQAEFSGGGVVEDSLLEPGPEQELYTDFQRISGVARSSAYQPALEAVATLRPAIDRFFDKVLVNAPDASVRQNRLTLLKNLLTEFSTIADFSEIVTPS